MARPKLIQTLVMILPIGTVVLGVISFFFYFRGLETATATENNQFAPMLRKDVDQADLERYVRTLSETLGPRSSQDIDVLNSSAAYIESTLGRMNMGYTVDRQSYEADGAAFHNLVAELPGKNKAKEIIVVGAHYDTFPTTPGADDNASGVAILLALAHSLTGTENQRTIRFVAFTNEEPPHYQTDTMGSRVYARSCVAKGEHIVAMLCLESLGYFTDTPGSQTYPPQLSAETAGYPTVGNFVAVVGNIHSKRLVDGFVDLFSTGTKLPIVGASLPPLVSWINASDHWSFWQEDIPAIMITDTAPLRNPHYHKPTDLPDTLDFASMAEVARGTEAALHRLANPDQ